MAERTLYVDDLAFAKDRTTTVPADFRGILIGLNGDVGEIDLSRKNKAGLDKALAPFILAARPKGRAPQAATTPQRTTRRASNNGAVVPKRTREENDEIRRWARGEGMPVADMGQIPSHIQAAWDARNIDEEPEIPIADRVRPVIYADDEKDYKARLQAWCGIKSIPIRRSEGKYGVSRGNIERFQLDTGVLPPK